MSRVIVAEDGRMLACAVCSVELYGLYDFRADSAPLCLSCHEVYRREVRMAIKTGRMSPLVRPTIEAPAADLAAREPATGAATATAIASAPPVVQRATLVFAVLALVALAATAAVMILAA